MRTTVYDGLGAGSHQRVELFTDIYSLIFESIRLAFNSDELEAEKKGVVNDDEDEDLEDVEGSVRKGKEGE